MTVCGVGSHSHEDRGDDFYATHRVAVDSLLAIETISAYPKIWEPACGDGAISKVLKASHHNVYSSDLVDRGYGKVQDFFKPTKRTADLIVTNPPFRLAREFVDVALERAPVVMMLLRLAFLEGGARMPWFQNGSLARVHVSSRRLPMMHRDGWTGPKAGSAVAHAWFVWDQKHKGHPQVRWFDYKEHSLARPRADNDNETIDIEELIKDAA